jgi:hypothetical protein
MCADPACDSTAKPPPGETWCPRRLEVEVWRWETGHPMSAGTPRPVVEMLP